MNYITNIDYIIYIYFKRKLGYIFRNIRGALQRYNKN